MLQQNVYHSVQVVCAIADALVLVVLFLNLSGREYDMSASTVDYAMLYGNIENEVQVMPRCACSM